MQPAAKLDQGTADPILKGLAEYLDLSLGDLLEGIVLHSFEGQTPSGAPALKVIEELRAIYGLTLTAADSHTLVETASADSEGRAIPEARR